MATARISPTASLLRSSKLFSLPPPLPKPSQAFKSQSTVESETATAACPTRAAIETTQSSLLRGDWGLKHSLPSRSIGATSTPLVRIGDIESINHITEFESAADLTMTLRKFQEFELPITKTQYRPKASDARILEPAVSVFEKSQNNIQLEEGDVSSDQWKFDGPWLAGQTEQGFQEYMRKNISGRKSAFRQFLREHLAKKEFSAQHERARDEAVEMSKDPVEITDQRLDSYIKHLRRNAQDLRQLVEIFLDLPRAARFPERSSDYSTSNTERSWSFFGPSKTHPSAGLSYLRTASRIHNHPIRGPQHMSRPIQGRFLVPQASASGKKRSRALVGIGGIVADDSKVTFQKKGEPRGSTRLDTETNVGNKHWFHAQRARVDINGRIKLHIQRTDQATLTLYSGTIDAEEPTSTGEAALPEISHEFPTSSNTWTQSAPLSSWGYGLENGSAEPPRLRTNEGTRPVDHKPMTTLNSASAMLNLGQMNR